MKHKSIGRCATVVVYGENAYVSRITARLLESSANRIEMIGPVNFSDTSRKQIDEVVLPLVDRIVGSLGVPQHSFEITLVDLDATSMLEHPTEISGRSMELSVFLALLSCTLNLPIRDEILCTGHIASIDGDIKMVRSIPAKLNAAVMEKTIETFIHPSLDNDNSVSSLLDESEIINVEHAINLHKDKINIEQVGDIASLLKKVFSDYALITASLSNDYFTTQFEHTPRNPINVRISEFFCKDLEIRYWQVFQSLIQSGKFDTASTLLSNRMAFQIKEGEYPDNFGQMVMQVMRTIPSSFLTQLPDGFIAIQTWTQLIQFAREDQLNDVYLFLQAINPNYWPSLPKTELDTQTASQTTITKEVVELVLNQISRKNLSKQIGRPFYNANSKFFHLLVVVESTEQFHQCVDSFYLHLMTHTRNSNSNVLPMSVQSDANDLLERAFSNNGGIVAALDEAKEGYKGGLPFICTRMTEQLINEEKEKYINFILTRAIKEDDIEQKIDFMRYFLKKIRMLFGDDISLDEPEYYAQNYKSLVRSYVQILDKLREQIF